MQAQTPAAESGFQRRSWAVQRVGWLVLAAWLLASATGVIGPGLASRASVTSPGHGLSVQYDRVLHLDAPTRVVVFLDRERAGALSLALGGAYGEAFQVQELVPDARAEAVGGAARRFTLELAAAGRTRVELSLVPRTWGWQTGELHVDGRPVVTLRHLVLP